MIRKITLACCVIFFSLHLFSQCGFAWSPLTHTLIARKAGISNPQYANFPDLSRNENPALLHPYHWHNAAPSTRVTPDYIDQYQITVGDYVKLGSDRTNPIRIYVPDSAGVLYWKILTLYLEMKGKRGWEYDYYLFSIAHYVGDLSQPLHNYPYGDVPASDGKVYEEIGKWAREKHREFDYILDPYFPLDEKSENILRASLTMPKIESPDDLKREIAKIANASIALANRCYREQRTVTKEEALGQIAKSISLLRAIIKNTKSNTGGAGK